MFHRLFRRLAEGILKTHKGLLLAWVVLIAAAMPFARQLGDHVARFEATRDIPGTESYATKQLLRRAFPEATADRRVVMVVKADDVRAEEVKRYFLRLEAEMESLRAAGEITDYSTPLQIYRTYVAGAARETHARLMGAARVPGNAAAAGMGLPAPGRGPTAGGVFPSTLLREVGALGAAPAEAGFDALARRVVAEVPLSEIPLEPSDGLLSRLISPDGKVALATVTFPDAGPFQPRLDRLRGLAARLAPVDASGLEVHVTSEKAIGRDMARHAERENARVEGYAVFLILAVLLVFFRSPVATLLTLALIQLSMVVSKALLFFLVRGGVELSVFTMPVMSLVMLGAGVDYSMILSERYRQERRAGHPKGEALRTALARAGESVFFSGVTVLIAFGAATRSHIGFLQGLGWGGLAGILTILAAVLTVTPGVLMLAGDRFFWPVRPDAPGAAREGPFARYLNATVRFTARYPAVITLVFALLLVPGLLILKGYDPASHPLALTPPTDAKAGYDLVAGAWGKGRLMPTEVVVRLVPGRAAGGAPTGEDLTALRGLVRRLEGVPGVREVAAYTQPLGSPLSDVELDRIPEDVRSQYWSADQRLLRVSVTLEGDPVSREAREILGRIRAVTGETSWPGATFAIGGGTLADQDFHRTLMDDFRRMLLLVSAGIFVALALQLRSLVVPVRLLLTILLGNVLTLAFLVGVFQWVRGVPIAADVPVLMAVLMMGLGLDYEIFLVTRVKEGVDAGLDDRTAVEEAVLKTGRVINFAGLLMAGTLGAMTLASTLLLQSYGAALGFAVLLDAIVLRTYLVPATMLLLREYNWWFPGLPGRPARRGGRPTEA